ncbi:hypothetical protein [Paraclostridium dentum]|uniref:hypothetical protein n=1 Tax=Paraclostridium dentum TaxID=2662455 RepID=UPI003F2E8088
MLIRLFVVLENNLKIQCQDRDGLDFLEDMLRITGENPTYVKTIWQHKDGSITEKTNEETQKWIEECY